MAELVLSTLGRAAGAALPGAWGGAASVIGRVGGALLGSAIDQQLFGEETRRVGARLTDLHVQGSSEGASIPAVFGSVRIAGQVIWAARFKEHEETQSQGGKGGPRVTSTNFRYTLSFAVGLCEGEVARIGRAWANGEPLDLSQYAWRLHKGSEQQTTDALIEAIEGADNAPAYRGLAYIVFEDLPLERFGNSIPQLSFEIIRPAVGEGPRFEDRVKGVCLIPGAGEFVYATTPIVRRLGPGQEAPENQHAELARANLNVSLDQLAADFPTCETVLLVVSWFGDDLRCGECTIRPKVEIADKQTSPRAWRVNGVTRETAQIVSTYDGGPAFGGTPDDASVLEAIAELKARGYKVGLYPFLMMDVPHGNALPDPYGGAAQAAYPWRGRITLHPAAGESGSPDQTGAATAQVDEFFGGAAPADFGASGEIITYAGPAEWSYRRFALHCAKLAAIAGGVDVFILGSELRGLTSARDSATHFPAVDALIDLAADVRAMIGPDTTLTYAADWSEYFGYQPQDASGDVFFHLDPLWADANIDVVGIDWYPSLTDWRDGAAHLDADLARFIHDPDYLEGRIEAGENYDWFYADESDRAAQTRTPITDGAHAEPWIYRAKDLRNFWSRAHHDRPAGVRASTPTDWVPESKPLWLIELGCPAVDKGANTPNLFSDAKSAESALPHFSSGARDDLIQRRVLDAYHRYWDAEGDNNPASALDGRPMIEAMFLWAFDARPYPAFPARADVWSDAPAWRVGHFLNGRASLSDLGEVVLTLCARAGVGNVDVSALRGAVSGYVVDAPASARDALAPLMAAYDVSVAERDGQLVFFHRDGDAPLQITPDDLAAESAAAVYAKRGDSADWPVEARVRFIDAARDYQIAGISARRLDRSDGGVASLDAPLVLEPEAAALLAQAVLADRRAGAETLALSLGPQHIALEPGDRVRFGGVVFEIARIEDAETRRVQLTRARSVFVASLSGAPPSTPPATAFAPTPVLAILDIPLLPTAEDDERPLVALFASPWHGAHVLYANDTAPARAIATQPATVGELVWALWPGPVDRWDDGNVTRVKLYGGALASTSRDDVLNGANAFAIESADGEYEIIQACECVLVAPGEYEISGLLRGRLGSAHAMQAPHPVGARIVKLDQRLARADIAAHEWGEPLKFSAPPAGAALGDARAATATLTLPHAAARPWAPAHLRARRLAGDDVEATWVRCARRGGDSWGAGEPPVGQPEAYLVEVLDGPDVVRSVETFTPSWTYSAADQASDFGAPPASLHIRVAQIDASGRAGLKSELTITL